MMVKKLFSRVHTDLMVHDKRSCNAKTERVNETSNLKHIVDDTFVFLRTHLLLAIIL